MLLYFFFLKYLIGKAIDRPPPLEEEITKEFADKMIEPFVTSAGAVLEALSSISLLNRYCMTLPADNFTQITVSWSKENTPNGVIVKVRLPMQSTVREEIEVKFNFIYYYINLDLCWIFFLCFF